MDLPRKEYCLKLLEENGVEGDTLKRTHKVNEVALHIAKKLQNNQEQVDQQLVNIGSLLHDVCKPQSDDSKGHEEKGAELLESKGYPEVANIIKKHKLTYITNNKFNNWEELIVYYADKRVRNTEIVSINERLNDLEQRYPKQKEDIQLAGQLLYKLEEQLFSELDIKPEDLSESLRKQPTPQETSS